MGDRRSQMHLPEEKEPRVGSAASDRLAPMQCGASPEARRRPRSVARTCGGAVSCCPPNYERAPMRLSLHQLPKCGEEQEWLNRAIPDTSHKITFAPHRVSAAAPAPVGSGEGVRTLSSGRALRGPVGAFARP